MGARCVSSDDVACAASCCRHRAELLRARTAGSVYLDEYAECEAVAEKRAWGCDTLAVEEKRHRGTEAAHLRRVACILKGQQREEQPILALLIRVDMPNTEKKGE